MKGTSLGQCWWAFNLSSGCQAEHWGDHIGPPVRPREGDSCVAAARTNAAHSLAALAYPQIRG